MPGEKRGQKSSWSLGKHTLYSVAEVQPSDDVSEMQAFIQPPPMRSH